MPLHNALYLSGDRNCHSVSLSCVKARVRCHKITVDGTVLYYLYSRRIDTWEQCGIICRKEHKCNGWEYQIKNKKCLLFKKCIIASDLQPGFLVGDKMCPRASTQ